MSASPTACQDLARSVLENISGINRALNVTPDDVNGVDSDPKINETHDGHNDKATTEAGNEAAGTVEAVKQEASRSPVESFHEPPFSWLQPHALFVIIMVGPEGMPFGIQKDFLCAKSSYYRRYFREKAANNESVEDVVELRDASVDVFGYTQHYLYTGHVYPDTPPDYEVLIGIWKLGHSLGIDGLCDATIDAMIEYRRITNSIPATALLVQVWDETPEGSSIRKLLLSWAADYMRASEDRAEFAKALPQEVLSELVVAMSSLDATPAPAATPSSPVSQGVVNSAHQGWHDAVANCDGEQARPAKRARYSDAGHTNGAKATPNGRKGPGRPSTTGPKTGQKRKYNVANGEVELTTSKKLAFCDDLLTRMLSGPGFWTRLVGPFRDPVNPESDGVPDYFDKVAKPMDLQTMRAKMDRNEYADENEFLADMNQIFNNCYTYWAKKDPMWQACERLQKTFEDKYSQMSKWIAKMEGQEGSN
ncbi:Bromodomain-containing protein [Neurospora tetrasperma FGSC 2509]|nr:Bromodomain-containing protein [Neurospora tetrasperma FGSC 2509]